MVDVQVITLVYNAGPALHVIDHDQAIECVNNDGENDLVIDCADDWVDIQVAICDGDVGHDDDDSGPID